MQLPQKNKLRRILISILAVVSLHVLVIYAFISAKAKPSRYPMLVYTSIVTDAKLDGVLYLALAQTPCVKLGAAADPSTPLPTCKELRPLPTDYQVLGDNRAIGLDFVIDEKGQIKDLKIASSSGLPTLDEAALNQVRDTWLFAPCEQNCLRHIRFRWQSAQ